MDRRVRHTQKVLNESLLKFLNKKEITKITVTEICADADVNRSTYYAYYSDPFDQLGKLKYSILKELTDYAAEMDVEQVPAERSVYYILKNILERVDTKRQVFRVLLARDGDHKLQHEILTMLGETAFAALLKETMSEEERMQYLIYASNGCFGMFYQWLMTEQPISADLLAQMMARFTTGV